MSQGTAPRICLNMIVRNEAAIIEACLEALLPVIDSWVICDTGSDDGTPELVRRFFDVRGIAGVLAHRPFVDFATTRNEALELCRASGEPFDYILLADADMELRIDDASFRSRLSGPAYLVRQSSSINYYNVRLLRRDVGARYVGATHEYLRVEAPVGRLEEIWFVDHECGSNRTNKLQRDEKLLLAELERDPSNPRAMYYLAQTYGDMGETEKAARWYRARAEAGGWEEEAWRALYALANCHGRLGDEPARIELLREAWKRRPGRAEPLLDLARSFRARGDHRQAALYALEGSKIAYPSGDILFVDSFTYRDGFRFELSISGWYSEDPGIRALARRYCLELAHDRGTPDACRTVARRNWEYYARPLGEIAGAAYREHELAIDVPAPYTAGNPSIAFGPGGLHAVVRSVNYRIADDGSYQFPPGDPVIRTRNVFGRIDASGALADAMPMHDRDEAPRVPSHIQGYEDCRLFHWRDGFWCTATVRDRAEDNRCEIALLRLAGDGSIVASEVFRSYGAQFHQKNWLPFVRDGRLFLLYSSDPTVVLEYLGTGELVEAGVSHSHLALEHLRGGGSPVRVGGEWIYLAHSVAPDSSGRRNYFHSFVRMADDFSIRSVSEPFVFQRPGIEFGAGLAFDEGERRLFVSYSIGDRKAMLAELPIDDLLSADVWIEARPPRDGDPLAHAGR